MTSVHELLAEFGAAVLTGQAGLFVGAGMSKPAYPAWKELLARPMAEVNLPATMSDLALAAEYYVQSSGRDRLEQLLLEELAAVDPKPHTGHAHLARLGITEMWTTNYDPLLEYAVPDAQVVLDDKGLLRRRKAGQPRIVKMHGSFTRDPRPTWLRPPVITRTDYERYADTHRRLWASLTADFLTRSLLFLGFGFADPNIEVLLRLARTLPTATSHFTVMRKPTVYDDEEDRLLHAHRVRDLEKSGVGVVEIDDWDELEPLLAQLVRRTRSPQVFISGSYTDDADNGRLAVAIGSRLAGMPVGAAPLRVASLAGPAGRHVSFAFGKELRARDEYDPTRIQFHFRAKEQPPEGLEERTGVALHADEDKDALRRRVIDDGRAMLVIGGGNNTREEVAIADACGVPVIPLGNSGGAAKQVFDDRAGDVLSMSLAGGPVNADDYRRLQDPDPEVAADAAIHLLAQAMYLDD